MTGQIHEHICNEKSFDEDINFVVVVITTIFTWLFLEIDTLRSQVSCVTILTININL
ncbi:hypothetical protein [Nostoc sp. MG11]|uniref:hypothetical protein n=1 Tax=Nostoc sp. MG11 TaxID=2721166 RepID=UPI001865B032|nr:hypothetical protein [Nostoc sp. MG11]